MVDRLRVKNFFRGLSQLGIKTTDTNTEKPGLRCLFLELPREVRDNIYTLIFISSTPLHPSSTNGDLATYISLLRTNKQIYNEAVKTLYSKNIFQIIYAPNQPVPQFTDFLFPKRTTITKYLPWTSHPLTPQICRAYFHLSHISIYSYLLSEATFLTTLFTLTQFPNLSHVQVLYPRSVASDIGIINVCRAFKDSWPSLITFHPYKKVDKEKWQDLSWMLWESSRKCWVWWTPDVDEEGYPLETGHVWKSLDGVVREIVICRPLW